MKESNWIFLCNEAAPYYVFNAGGRPYHNGNHAMQVLDNCKLIVGEKMPSDSLMLAALWHDAVYIPGAPNGTNEDASAAALDYAWRCGMIDEPIEILTTARHLIGETRVSNHLSSRNIDIVNDLAILLDADLASLAAPYEEFFDNQENIFGENLGFNQEHQAKQREFIARFLTCRPNIYHTQRARELWEDAARANIKQFVDQQ